MHMPKSADAAASGAKLAFVDFQLPTLVVTPPAGESWLQEIKHDGYRTQLIIENGAARALTRRGFDWPARYAPVVEAAARLAVRSAVIDGEMVVFNDKGISDFQMLRSARRWQPERLVFIAFDLIHLNGQDLRSKPLSQRRAALQDIVGDSGGAIQFSESLAGNGSDFFRAADRMGLEGIVSKRADSPYRGGRTATWLKTKCFEESAYEVAGVLRNPVGRQSPT